MVSASPRAAIGDATHPSERRLPLGYEETVSSLGKEPLLAFAVVFLAFFPYPAAAIGSAAGVQLNHLLAFALLPLLVLGELPWRHIVVYMSLMVGMLVSGFVGLLVDDDLVPDLLVKAMIAMAIATVILLPAGRLARAANLPAILIGVGWAIVVHVLVGIVQIVAFGSSTFPLLGIYRNPSFAAIESVATDYAVYIKRPFGLFPEPSAMSASLGPWLILLLGMLLQRKYRYLVPGWARLLMVVAFVGGSVLMVNARSGYVPLWVAAALPILIAFPVSNGAPGKSRSTRMIVMSAFGLVMLVAAAANVQTSLGGSQIQADDSWSARWQSILIAITTPTKNIVDTLVGIGPGQAATFLLQTPTSSLLPTWYETSTVTSVVTVWSVLGTLYMEMGLVGLSIIALISVLVARAIARSSARMLGCCVFAAWLAGVSVTTSYFALSPIWLTLAMLLAWDALFPPVRAADPITGGAPS